MRRPMDLPACTLRLTSLKGCGDVGRLASLLAAKCLVKAPRGIKPHSIDLYRDRSLQKLNGEDELITILLAQDDAFQAAERPDADPNDLSRRDKGAGFRIKGQLDHSFQTCDFLVINGEWAVARAQNSDNARNGDYICV
jgi:hypothetical protein